MILLCYLLLVFLIFSGGIFTFYVLFLSLITNLQREDRKYWHGSLMLIGTLCSGIGIMIFRLFIGVPTRDVKFFHLVVHTIGAVFIFLGFAYSDSGTMNYEAFKNRSDVQELSGAQLHIYSDVHIKMGSVTLFMFGFEYIFGWFMYTCIPMRSIVRLRTAPFHDVFGLWIFLCEISSVTTGIYMMFDMNEGFRMMETDFLWYYPPVVYMNCIFILLYGAGVIVLNAIICPYFDWELVGAL